MRVCPRCNKDENSTRFYNNRGKFCATCQNNNRQARRVQKLLDRELSGVLVPDEIICKSCNQQKSSLDFHVENLSRCKLCKAVDDRDRKVQNFARTLISGAVRRTKEDLSLPPCTLTEDDVRIPETDPVLGIPLFIGVDRHNQGMSPSIDRLIPEEGYVPSNCRIISHRANQIKNNAEPWELLKVCAYALQIHKNRIPNYQETVDYIQWLADKLKPIS